MVELIYTSELPDGDAAAHIARIATEARRGFRAAMVTGLLIFDGWRYCEYLEGEPDALRRRVQQLATDPHLQGFTLRHYAAHTLPERRFRGWSLGFADPDGEHSLDALFAETGPASIARLLALMPWLDSAP